MSIDRVRVSPFHRIWLACRCGEPVNLPQDGESSHVCRCGRRFSFDGVMLTVVRPDGERETP